ncbi:hypothetical protein BO82DRAFT_408124 [Aspergillus uvarum CBS 121591]|uniref:Uncharacterized protein n=1 Tax=Aspergillus uvarum CBS 121591 TaxID=1448315 RepID=A0A319D7Q8_9EURO|nr:hypothetical protein BO82DRAFT_408124 [Aspergillus uvarum CBS 121591]PYH87003.1 hypothetical protein BO82DRAFT_408124 [Aspergillus uvarum CBS 121591]
MEHHCSTFHGLPRAASDNTDLSEVDIRGIDKVLLLRVLYNQARLTTTAVRPFDFDLARQVMAAPILTTDMPNVGSWLSISTFCGRVIGVALTRNTAQGWIYDQLNEPGAFDRAVARARQLTANSLRWRVGALQAGDRDRDRDREGEGERERTPPPPYSER